MKSCIFYRPDKVLSRVHSFIQNLSIGDQQTNLNYPQGNLIQDSVYVNCILKSISLKGFIKSYYFEGYYLTWWYLVVYHNAIDMLLLTDKLNLKCYVLYESYKQLQKCTLPLLFSLCLLSVLPLLISLLLLSL